MTRDDCLTNDARDPLAPLRARFALDRVDREGVIYLDGNSLGVLPKSAIDRARDVVESEWGAGLIRSWNAAGWITLAQRIGDKIAALVGAGPGELIVADSTSINLHKALDAAIASLPLFVDSRSTRLLERLVLGGQWLVGLVVLARYAKGLSPWWWCALVLMIGLLAGAAAGAVSAV